MKISVKTGHPEKLKTDCLILGIPQSRTLSPEARKIDDASKGLITNLRKSGDMDGSCGRTLLVSDPDGINAKRLLLVGCGKPAELDGRRFQTLVAKSLSRLSETGASNTISLLTLLDLKDRDFNWQVDQSIRIAADSEYCFEETRSKKSNVRKKLTGLTLVAPGRREQTSGEKIAKVAKAVTSGMELTRTLGNLPGNICTPAYLADQARKLGRNSSKIKVTVLGEPQMKKLGMGALLSVSRGSREPARLITMEYHGGPKTQKPVVLVGKGITFDSGGISIKPGAAMDEMKFDMCGAASVFGVIKACTELKLKRNVVGIVTSAENMPGGNASKPGDVVTSMSGQTIEVLNTDAEGRLVLCDALTYADRFKPDTVIDIATLTGACVIALGNHATGLLSNNDRLASDLLDAGEKSGDRAWQLPLWDEYQGQLDSNFADMANIGGREAGTITAACFLSRFTKNYRWAHLDIAGVAWKSGKDKGATGRPVPLLMRYLTDR